MLTINSKIELFKDINYFSYNTVNQKSIYNSRKINVQPRNTYNKIPKST